MEAALSPMAHRCDLDYAESAFSAPATERAIAFEALRACSSLLMAFAYEDAWPAHDRHARRFRKRGAFRIRQSFSDDAGRDAISWITQRYGDILAAMRRRGVRERGFTDVAREATAKTDEWLAGLVKEAWPVVGRGEALELAHARARSYDVDNPNALVDLRGHADRVEATVEMLCIAAWPVAADVLNVLTPWTYQFNLEFADALLVEWSHVSEHWANLLQPTRLSYAQLAEGLERP